MNQHINKLEDPVVTALRKQAVTSAKVNHSRRIVWPRFVRIPGKRRLVPTGRVPLKAGGAL